MSEAALTPDVYSPIVGGNGKYCDSTNFTFPGAGIKCGCSSNKVFLSKMTLKAHCKRPIHKKWIFELENQSKNHFKELLKAKEIMTQQRKQIAELQITVSNLTVDLQRQRNVPTIDLLGELD